MEDRLYADLDLAQFYDFDNGWGADLGFCAKLAEEAGSVLDLGCGTGLFLAKLGSSCVSVGVDPAPGMLQLARQREGTAHVEWVEGDARGIRLGRCFELVVMTGHAFQVFLSGSDRRAAIATIAAHLAPGGRFIFDTRNPADDEWRTWTPKESRRSFEHPDFGMVEAWNDVSQDAVTGVVTYETHYRLASDGRQFSSASKIAFPAKAQVATFLEDAGLVVDTWMGDWTGAPCTADAPDIIPVGHLR